MRGLVLEGVSGSGKTALFSALQRRLPPAATKLVLSEHLTDRVLERRRRTLRIADALDHVDRVLAPVRAFAELEAGSHLAGRGGDAEVYVLVERLLGSHLAYLARRGVRPNTAEDTRIVAFYQDLAARGIGVVALRLPPDVLPGAVLSTRDHRGAAWRAWLASMGDDDAIVAGFTAWQDGLFTAFAALPEPLRPDVVDMARPADPDAVETLAERLADRWLLRPGTPPPS